MTLWITNFSGIEILLMFGADKQKARDLSRASNKAVCRASMAGYGV
jgi:hypothetical protein